MSCAAATPLASAGLRCCAAFRLAYGLILENQRPRPDAAAQGVWLIRERARVLRLRARNVRPLRLVADAFLPGSRQEVEAFYD
ncbi:hypothetical protein BN2476_460071 [Paraburkholderia piptadeniae]|uniref:Uncharacterized protein n=1 Tax=Paraburkholderia piptadeniae TaxID=1701573 RepID=A0A1N7SCX2_9BURK|nr:hypothetical protein BN2476_460071 [Paraburkholderia piptadeniae]